MDAGWSSNRRCRGIGTIFGWRLVENSSAQLPKEESFARAVRSSFESRQSLPPSNPVVPVVGVVVNLKRP